MTPHSNDGSGDPISGWDNEGGAVPADPQRQTLPRITQAEGGKSQRDRLDASHESDVRGEHRYPNVGQTEGQRRAREDRDDLKRALGGQRRNTAHKNRHGD